MKCDYCQPQLLPMLYDLLDETERTAVERHLETCTICQEALQSAREQGGLLKDAVKQSHPEITFKAPMSSAPTVAMPPRPSRRFAWINAWSIAASILLVFFAGGGVVGWFLIGNENRVVDTAQGRLAKAKSNVQQFQNVIDAKQAEHQKEIEAVQKQIDALFTTWKAEENKTRKVLEEKRVQLVINGPQVALAGAKNNYSVEVRQGADIAQNFANNVLPDPMNFKKIDKAALAGLLSELQVEAVNQRNNEVLFRQNLRLRNNNANFDLPADMPIKPGDDITLQFRGQTNEGKFVELRDQLKLLFPEYVTHITTDRPMYRPGETVRFRSLSVERFSLQPAREKFHLRFRIVGPNGVEIHRHDAAAQVILDGKQAPIVGPDGQPLAGLGVGDFALPADLPGGEYSVVVSEVNERFREEKRSFIVHRWQQPRFNKDLTFHRASYGPGDRVLMTVHVVPVQGFAQGFANNLRLKARAVVDGQVVNVRQKNEFNELSVNADGMAELEFDLPDVIAKGVGIVTIECNDGGPIETFQRSIPIVTRDLDIEFYPEGGDLIAGVPNRVYFQARTPIGKPADIMGSVRDSLKNAVVRIETVRDDSEAGINQGMGSFTFTPTFGQRYTFAVEAPIGLLRSYPLPEVKKDGVVLHTPNGLVQREIAVTLHATQRARELFAGAYCRGRLLDFKLVKVLPGTPLQTTLKPAMEVGGVYRITVFEKIREANEVRFQPVAERLIYRENTRKVDVEVQPHRTMYQPSNAVVLGLHAFDEQKKSVPAIAMVAVVDQSVRKLADEKTARAMPTHFLLTTEIRNSEDLENADILLSDHPRAKVALDLLLGCQGWRRFAEQNPLAFKQKLALRQEPIFVANSANVEQFLESEQKQIEKLDQSFVTKAIALEKQLAAKEKAPAIPDVLWNDANQKQNDMEQIASEIVNARRRAAAVRAYLIQFALGGVMLTLLFVSFFLISLGLRRLSDGEGEARRPMVYGLTLLGLLFFASVIGTFAFMGERMFDDEAFDHLRNGMRPPPVAVFNQRDLNQLPVEPAPFFNEVPKQLRIAANDPQLPEPPLVPLPQANDERKGKKRWNGRPDLAARINFNVDDEEMLRRQGDYHAAVIRRLGRRVQVPPVNNPCIVREYAHRHAPSPDGIRRDFTETLYWHPVLVMADGTAEVKFDLNDAITRFDVIVLTHTLDGRLGSNRAEFSSRLPFRIDPRVPTEVNETDTINVPIAISNDLAKPLSVNLATTTTNLLQIEVGNPTIKVKPTETKRAGIRFKPSIPEGDAMLRVVGTSGGYSDGVERKFKIVRDGFPIHGAVGGLLTDANTAHTINLPEKWIAGSLKVEATFYPSPLADLQAGLDALLAEPCGCFEQSSSRNYPNVLALSFLQKAGQPNPVIEKRARGLLQTGYTQLTGFECLDPEKRNEKQGYEWFGQTAPPHEALTAYGLLQFRDMAKVSPVDADMLRRTEQYLLGQRDGKGGFRRNARALDQFGRAPAHITDAYILWALTESGVTANLDVELTAVRNVAKKSKDPYLLALTGLSHLNAKKHADGIEMLSSAKTLQDKAGRLDATETTITGSQGRDRAVETTALMAIGWLKANRPAEFTKHIHSAIGWLAGQRQGTGGFGGTQATILALKAMLAYAEHHPLALQQCDVQLLANVKDKAQIDDVNFQRGARFEDVPIQRTREAIATILPRSLEPVTIRLNDVGGLQPGNNTVTITNTGQTAMPYSLAWSYRVQKPTNDPTTAVKLTTALSKKEVREGDTVKLTANLKNVSGKGQGMAVAIIGLPGGLALPEDLQQLKAFARAENDGAKPGVISAWELRGRELVLYWRELGPDANITVELDLISRLPGAYTGPASRAYLYYAGERKHWTEPLAIAILEGK